MQCPAERYVPSTRPYRGLPNLDYPFHDRTATVTTCGRICLNRQNINLSVVFAGQSVGIKQVSDELSLVSFMDYNLCYFDHETCRLEPIENLSLLKICTGLIRLEIVAGWSYRHDHGDDSLCHFFDIRLPFSQPYRARAQACRS
jgi:putative transposase